jgi:hypothetical protein
MAKKTVKHKVPFLAVVFLLAVGTFAASWARLFPPAIVEKAYSRALFPTISHMFGLVSDAVPFSWLDVCILGLIALLIYVVKRRRWKLLLGTVSVLYLWFFWTWGLNYHRPPVTVRLHLPTDKLTDQEVRRFTEMAAKEINRLWSLSQSRLERAAIADLATQRVDRVVLKIDGTSWRGPHRVKRSLLLEPWYKIAGVDGMFNPFGHEPLVISGPYPYELPFLMSHEIAHTRGVANEGEANLVALLATIASEDPRFQYSGWLHLWGYLPDYPEVKLDDGPRADLRAIGERYRSHEIKIANQVQSAILDAHLKANAVPAGLRSYSEFVSAAIASQPRWGDFR